MTVNVQRLTMHWIATTGWPEADALHRMRRLRDAGVFPKGLRGQKEGQPVSVENLVQFLFAAAGTATASEAATTAQALFATMPHKIEGVRLALTHRNGQRVSKPVNNPPLCFPRLSLGRLLTKIFQASDRENAIFQSIDYLEILQDWAGAKLTLLQPLEPHEIEGGNVRRTLEQAYALPANKLDLMTPTQRRNVEARVDGRHLVRPRTIITAEMLVALASIFDQAEEHADEEMALGGVVETTVALAAQGAR